MKIFMVKFFLFFAVLCLALGGAAGYMVVRQFNTPSTNTTEKLIVLPKGWGTMRIADTLAAQGIISDATVFALATKIIDKNSTLKAGEYQFTPHMTMRDVITKLKKGDTYKRQFTIPEGLTSFEIVERLKLTVGVDVSIIPPVPPEGSLLPDTYDYQVGDTITSLITRMNDAHRRFVAEAWEKRVPDLPFQTVDEALTLASIVEKETGVADERRRIAGVFINRLRQGMMLQSDPTVIYGLTRGQHQKNGQGPLGRRLLSKDLKTKSPYNTYSITGLPPTPIANAGRAAILATLNPETHDYLFFVADGSGGHAFARTLAEHNYNVARWRRIRQAQ